MNLSLNGFTALVCGGSQGIGRALAKELAELGATCLLAARSEAALAEALSSLPKQHGQTHRSHIVDLGDASSLEKMVAWLQTVGPVHILINNSGGPAPGPLAEAQPEAFVQAFRQHLVAAQTLSRALLPGMKAAGYGRIVNIVSTSVKTPLKNLGVSNTVRGAVASWAKTLSNEVAAFGITVNNVLPGLTKTGRLESLIADTARRQQATTDEVANRLLAEVPAQRFADPAEVAAVAAFLCTPAAGYVNGTNIAVDGGRTPAL